jgi:cobalt-zinc-cadmium resistance protein CzcA
MAGKKCRRDREVCYAAHFKEMNAIPNKTSVRSISLFGLSVVTVIFDDHVNDFYAQQYASNKLGNVESSHGSRIQH